MKDIWVIGYWDEDDDLYKIVGAAEGLQVAQAWAVMLHAKEHSAKWFRPTGIAWEQDGEEWIYDYYVLSPTKLHEERQPSGG